jgi:hypothetical protein
MRLTRGARCAQDDNTEQAGFAEDDLRPDEEALRVLITRLNRVLGRMPIPAARAAAPAPAAPAPLMLQGRVVVTAPPRAPRRSPSPPPAPRPQPLPLEQRGEPPPTQWFAAPHAYAAPPAQFQL